MSWLVSLLLVVVAGAVVEVVRNWVARRRRAAAATGDVVVVHCRRRFSGQRRFRGGRLVVGDGRVLCQGRSGSRDLSRARLLRVRSVVERDRADNQDLVLIFDLGDTLLEVALAERDVDTVAGTLARTGRGTVARTGSGSATGGTPGMAGGTVIRAAAGLGVPDGGAAAAGRSPARRVPVWSAVLLVLVALTAVAYLYLYLYLSGSRVEARVLSGPDDLGACRVSWADPHTGVLQHAVVDCADGTRPGSRVPVLALPWPFAGDAYDLYDTPRYLALLLGVLLSAAVAGSHFGGGGPARRARPRSRRVAGPVRRGAAPRAGV